MSRTGALLLPSLFGLMSCQPQVVISEAHAPLGEGVFKMLLSLVSHIITTMGLDFWCCKSFPQRTLPTPETLRSIKQVALRTEIYLWLKSPCGQPCDFLMWRAEGQLREKSDFQQEVSDLLCVRTATSEVVMEWRNLMQLFEVHFDIQSV